MIKSIYVRKGDEPFWEWAEKQASESGESLSKWLADLLRNRKYAASPSQDDNATPADIVRDIRFRADEALAILDPGEEP